jgi:hypothetical protein
MQGLRSRAGIVALTACALALLSVPVIALGKGPPDGKGGGGDTAATVVPPQANVPHAAPGQLDKPAVAPKPAPPGQAKPKPRYEAKPVPPGHAKGQSQPAAPAPSHGLDGSGPPGQGPKKESSPPYGLARGHAEHWPSSEPAEGSGEPANAPESGSGSPDSGSGSGAPDEPSRSPRGRSPSAGAPEVTGGIDLPSADTADNGDGGVAAAAVSDTVDLPAEANPETLPFTGLQLGVIGLAGLAALAGGLALRRTVTR